MEMKWIFQDKETQKRTTFLKIWDEETEKEIIIRYIYQDIKSEKRYIGAFIIFKNGKKVTEEIEGEKIARKDLAGKNLKEALEKVIDWMKDDFSKLIDFWDEISEKIDELQEFILETIES